MSKRSPVSLATCLEALVDGSFKDGVWIASDEWNAAERRGRGVRDNESVWVSMSLEKGKLWIDVALMEPNAKVQSWGWLLGMKGVRLSASIGRAR